MKCFFSQRKTVWMGQIRRRSNGGNAPCPSRIGHWRGLYASYPRPTDYRNQKSNDHVFKLSEGDTLIPSGRLPEHIIIWSHGRPLAIAFLWVSSRPKLYRIIIMVHRYNAYLYRRITVPSIRILLMIANSAMISNTYIMILFYYTMRACVCMCVAINSVILLTSATLVF